MMLYCLLVVAFLASLGHAFSPSPFILRSRSTDNSHTGNLLNSFRRNYASVRLSLVIDPAMFPLDIGIAAVSAAAGALAQVPKIQELERELDTTRAALTDSEQQLVSQIHELEERLFVMDREFEGQTDKFKKQYDVKMRDDLQKITEKMKVDFQYTLEIKVEEEKSKLLLDKLDVTNSLTGQRQVELVNLRLQRSRIEDANQALEKAMDESKAELDRLREAALKRTGWWPF
jgi:hypothetical protein